MPRLNEDDRRTAELALQPLRRYTTVPVVGVQGGAGRTTVTRLLGRAFAQTRQGSVAAVDAVPLWGGLTSAVAGANRTWTIRDVASMPWPSTQPINELLRSTFAADGPVPTVMSQRPSQPTWTSGDVILDAIRRVSAMVDLTIVDSVADPASDPTRRLILTPHLTPVWVCAATRAGLWGIGEVLSHYERLGSPGIVARSVVAAVGHRRHWPAEAAAAEVQLSGRGLETIRVPYSRDPLADPRCARAGLRLLAAVAARSRE